MGLFARGQTARPFPLAADSVKSLVKLIQRGPDDSTRSAANAVFREHLQRYLSDSLSFTVPPYQEAGNLGCVESSDRRFRLYTWVAPSYSGDSYRYFGFLQVRDPKSGAVLLTELLDSTTIIQKPELEKLRANRWLGCVYYQVIPVKKGARVFYTLLGWKGKSERQTQKLIEVLYFDKNEARFGFPLFRNDKVYRSRRVFTFNAMASMALRYEQGKRWIVFDHLSGSANDPMAGPDGRYDAYRFKRGRWNLMQNVDVRGGNSR
jgi:hypothetical protein